ncbi:MAG: hypothetical protein IH898_12745 [Planctomycetes bacterium]|nr:hypothetical protein [Planctomycetota bacterium]
MSNALANLAALVLLCPMACSPAWCQYQPSPAFVPPSSPGAPSSWALSKWGGTLVSPRVPYQPSALFVQPGGDQSPIFLDEMPSRDDPYFRVAGLTTNLVPPAEDLAQPTEPQLPPGTRDGLFQKIYFTGTWLPRLEDDSLGVSSLETGVVFGFPFFRRDTPLLVTPQFAVHYLDGPTTPDLPARLYDAAVEFRHMRQFGDGPWAMDVAVTTGYYSDFQHGDADAFRVTGRGLAVYESSPAAKWILGVAYLNRAGASVLPVAGVIYEPTPDVRWDLIFPRPKVAWRLPWGVPGCGDDKWVYVGGEFGGGIWSIERPVSLTQDLLTYRDFRVLAGYERKIIGGLSRRFEVGYIFGRELEFDSATPDVSLDDTLFLRAGLTY